MIQSEQLRLERLYYYNMIVYPNVFGTVKKLITEQDGKITGAALIVPAKNGRMQICDRICENRANRRRT